jgi:hypothetical protein
LYRYTKEKGSQHRGGGSAGGGKGLAGDGDGGGEGERSATAPGDLAMNRPRQHHQPPAGAARRVLQGPLASHGPSAARRKHRKGHAPDIGGEVSYERSVLAPRPPGGLGEGGARPSEAAAAQARRAAMAAKAEAEQAAALMSQQVEALTRILSAAPHDDRGKLLRGVLNNAGVITPHDLEELTNSVMQLSVPAEKLELAGVFLDQKAYFSALRCVYTDQELLAIMLNSIKMAISASNDSSEKAAAAGKDDTVFWSWQEGDRSLFCMQFADLAIVQNYTAVRENLEALGKSGSKAGLCYKWNAVDP